MADQPTSVRLDKWLWSVRFFKTRSLATDAVSSGKVTVDGSKAKPSRPITVGQRLVVKKGPFEFSVTVNQLIEKRVGAKVAELAYTESELSIEKRAELQEKLKDDRIASQGERLAGRPSKRDRRLIHRFKTSDSS
ncbi:MAG: RNA-binding S4 domain-containing protein [Pseudomonadota bacterium]